MHAQLFTVKCKGLIFTSLSYIRIRAVSQMFSNNDGEKQLVRGQYQHLYDNNMLTVLSSTCMTSRGAPGLTGLSGSSYTGTEAGV